MLCPCNADSFWDQKHFQNERCVFYLEVNISFVQLTTIIVIENDNEKEIVYFKIT